MANNLLSSQIILKETVRLFKNSNAFLKNIDTQYDSQYANTGAKIGNTLKIRMPNDYAIRTGPTAVVQDTKETFTTLTIANQIGVDISFSSVDRTLTLDRYSERYIAPAVNNMAGYMAGDVMSLAESIPNLVHNTDGSGNTIAPTANTWLQAGAILDNMSVPRMDRKIVMDPITQANTVSSLAGLFNNQQKIGQQYTSGEIGSNVLGYDWMMDQTVIKHQTGAYGTLPTVNGAGQSGSSINVTALAGPLLKGDIISFAGVFSVNRVSKASTNVLAQFVVTANTPAGATSIPIYPPLMPPVTIAGLTGTAGQTVSASPANGAAVTSPVKAGEVYRKNVAFRPEAFTLATADLELPRGVHEAHRENQDGISVRLVTFYQGITDQMVTRLDVLYGYTVIRPEWACVVADAP